MSYVEMINNNKTKSRIVASGGGDQRLVLTDFVVPKCASKFS